jgi:hypothetical protein
MEGLYQLPLRHVAEPVRAAYRLRSGYQLRSGGVATYAAASLRDALAAALEANREMARLAAELREENARLREENAELREENAELRSGLEQARADLSVLQRMLFGRSSERSRLSRLAVMKPAVGVARSPGAARALSGGRERGRGGGLDIHYQARHAD